MYRTWITDSVNEGIEKHDFGATDGKGRALGCTVEFETQVFTEIDPASVAFYDRAPGTYYAYRTRATRNGVTFGAYQQWIRCSTEADRYTAVAKYLENAAKRAAKTK